MQYLLRYLLAINLATFIIRGIDKYKARKQKRRISEKTLLYLSLLGGFLGAILGMNSFRHKTIKGSFLRKFWLIALVWIVLLMLLMIKG